VPRWGCGLLCSMGLLLVALLHLLFPCFIGILLCELMVFLFLLLLEFLVLFFMLRVELLLLLLVSLIGLCVTGIWRAGRSAGGSSFGWIAGCPALAGAEVPRGKQETSGAFWPGQESDRKENQRLLHSLRLVDEESKPTKTPCHLLLRHHLR